MSNPDDVKVLAAYKFSADVAARLRSNAEAKLNQSITAKLDLLHSQSEEARQKRLATRERVVAQLCILFGEDLRCKRSDAKKIIDCFTNRKDEASTQAWNSWTENLQLQLTEEEIKFADQPRLDQDLLEQKAQHSNLIKATQHTKEESEFALAMASTLLERNTDVEDEGLVDLKMAVHEQFSKMVTVMAHRAGVLESCVHKLAEPDFQALIDADFVVCQERHQIWLDYQKTGDAATAVSQLTALTDKLLRRE